MHSKYITDFEVEKILKKIRLVLSKKDAPLGHLKFLMSYQ